MSTPAQPFTFVLINGPFQDYSFVSLEQHHEHLADPNGYINCSQSEITVVNEDAAREWQSLYSDYMNYTWEPNLSPEGREENLALADEYSEKMRKLEAEGKLLAEQNSR